MKRTLIPVFLLFVALILSCSSSKELEKEEVEDLLDMVTYEMTLEPTVAIALENYRNSLSDNYASLQNTIPASFRDVKAQEERRNRNYGFRVQIISTPDVGKADEAQSEFAMWVDTLDIDIIPEAYIIFRQPNYRVHVGDFLDRSDAIQFSQFVRQKFPHAWVVHDRINPAALYMDEDIEDLEETLHEIEPGFDDPEEPEPVDWDEED